MSVRAAGLVLLGAVLAGAVLVGLLGFRDAAGDAAIPARPPQNAAATQPSPHGAVRAATEFLTSMDLERLLSARWRNRIIRRSATPEASTALQALYADEARRVASSYNRAPRFARAALAGYRVDEFTPPDATVAIWAASIGGSGSYAPTAGWSTTTVSLRWLGNAWRVADVQHAAGPAPEWPTATLAAEGRRFREFRHVP